MVKAGFNRGGGVDTLDNEICRFLIRNRLCSSEEEFSHRYLGRCRSYFGAVKSLGKGASIESLVILNERLKLTQAQLERLGQNEMANVLALYSASLSSMITTKCIEGISLTQ